MAIDYSKKPTDERFIDECATPLTESQAAVYLRLAWIELFSEEPSLQSLAILWGQSALETGRWKSLRNNNWGNIKKINDVKYTSYFCSEVINGVNIKFYPYNPQTFFAAWNNPLDGAKGYLRFISEKPRYAVAWAKLKEGNPIAYVYALKAGGYFTASVESYSKVVMSLYNEFLSKSTALLSWGPPKPPEPEIIKPAEPVLPETVVIPPVTDYNVKSVDIFSTIINFLRILFKTKS